MALGGSSNAACGMLRSEALLTSRAAHFVRYPGRSTAQPCRLPARLRALRCAAEPLPPKFLKQLDVTACCAMMLPALRWRTPPLTDMLWGLLRLRPVSQNPCLAPAVPGGLLRHCHLRAETQALRALQCHHWWRAGQNSWRARPHHIRWTQWSVLHQFRTATMPPTLSKRCESTRGMCAAQVGASA